MKLQLDITRRLTVNGKMYWPIRSVLNFRVIGIEPRIFIYISNEDKLADSRFDEISFFDSNKVEREWYKFADYESTLNEVLFYVLNKSVVDKTVTKYNGE